MRRSAFEKIVAEEFPRAVPERFRARIKNVGFVVEAEPSAEVRSEHKLTDDETLLGLYRGVPATERGDTYGVGLSLPDVITLYQIPIEEEAGEDIESVRTVVRETIWHEVAHYFGFDEGEVAKREAERP